MLALNKLNEHQLTNRNNFTSAELAPGGLAETKAAVEGIGGGKNIWALPESVN